MSLGLSDTLWRRQDFGSGGLENPNDLICEEFGKRVSRMAG